MCGRFSLNENSPKFVEHFFGTEVPIKKIRSGHSSWNDRPLFINSPPSVMAELRTPTRYVLPPIPSSRYAGFREG